MTDANANKTAKDAGISIEDAIAALRSPGEFPADAISLLQTRWSEASGPLLDALQGNIDIAFDSLPLEEEIDEDDPPEYEGWDDLGFQAAFLFAQFRHKEAFPELMRLFDFPLPEEALGDFLFAGLPRCLAATWPGDLKPLRELLHDPDGDEYARSGALVAMTTLLAWGDISWEDLRPDLLAVLRSELTADDGFLLGSAAFAAARLPVDQEMLALARRILSSKSIDSRIFPSREFEAQRKAFSESDWPKNLLVGNEPVVDAAAEIAPWFDPSEEDYDENGDWIPPEPVEQLKSEKVGRNDPCPCGSGKKHKKCCGKDD